MVSATERRKEVISYIENSILKAKEGGLAVDFNRFKSEISLEFGLSERKIKEYFQQLEIAQRIEVSQADDGVMVVSLKEKPKEEIKNESAN